MKLKCGCGYENGVLSLCRVGVFYAAVAAIGVGMMLGAWMWAHA